jgi:dihydroorotase
VVGSRHAHVAAERAHAVRDPRVVGGVTSVFEMPNTIPATINLSTLNDKVQSAKNKAWVNMAFYVGASSENISELNQLEYAPGCCGVKIFMGSSTGSLLVEDDKTLLKVLKNGKRRVAVHCEDEYRLRERKHIALEGKHASYHPTWRDEESALKATTRIVNLAKEARRPVHVLHVNSSDEIEFLAAHKNIASVEVLPQHLTLFAPDCYDRLGNYTQQNPPIRSKEHLESLWSALQKGVVDIIGSDHAPHTHEEKSKEYPQSPSGMPGVQTLLPIMLNHIHNGKLSLDHLVRLVAHNPVRLFGIKNKGHIRKGFDADLTLIDLKLHRRIENSWIASRCGWTPFDGMQITGWPQGTIIGGELKMFEDQIIGSHSGKILEFDI